MVRLSIVKNSESKKWINLLSKFTHITIKIQNSSHSFILTDNPFLLRRVGEEIHAMALALSPSTLWIATSFNNIDQELIKSFVSIYNVSQIAQDPEYIISSEKLKNDDFYNWDKMFVEGLKSPF